MKEQLRSRPSQDGRTTAILREFSRSSSKTVRKSAIIGFGKKKQAPLFEDNSDCGQAPGRKEEFMGDEDDVCIDRSLAPAECLID
jgi:hypothetical protein